MADMHVRLNFNLSNEKGIKHHSLTEHDDISKIANLVAKCCKDWKI